MSSDGSRIYFDPQYKFLKQKFLSAQRMIIGFHDMGSGRQLSLIFQSVAGGSYLFGTDALPIPQLKHLHPLQGIYCDTLKILNRDLFPVGQHVSQATVLEKLDQPSLINAHKKSLLTRVSEILRTGLPKQIFERLKDCFYFGLIDKTHMIDYVDIQLSSRKWDNWKRRCKLEGITLPCLFWDDQFTDLKNSLSAGKYFLWMKYPEDKLKNKMKVPLRETFPYNTIDIFNEEPPAVRNLAGTHAFRDSIRMETKWKCQHRLSSKGMKFCSACKPQGYKHRAALGNIERRVDDFCSLCYHTKGRVKNRSYNILKNARSYTPEGLWEAIKNGSIAELRDIPTRCTKIQCRKPAGIWGYDLSA